VSQDAPHVLRLPDEARTLEAPHADDLAELIFLVAQHVTPGACIVWLWLWRKAGYRPGLAAITAGQAGGLVGVSHVQGRTYIEALAACGLLSIVNRREGRYGGFDLRIEDAPAVLSPGPKTVRGDPQRPLAIEPENCNPNGLSLSVSSDPIIDHGARSTPSSVIGDRSGETPLTNEHEGDWLNVKSPVSVEDRQLAALVQRRRREMRSHLETNPHDAGSLRQVIGEVLEEVTDAEQARRQAAHHKTVCDMIVANVNDPELPIGLVHDVADRVVSGELSERSLARIFAQMRRRTIRKSRGGYFRVCIQEECLKRGVAPPQAPRGP
jgi:hypothetical protein